MTDRTARAARNQERSLAAFLAKKAEFDALLAELTQASADHFGADPETVLWGEAAWLSDPTAKLKDIADQHFRHPIGHETYRITNRQRHGLHFKTLARANPQIRAGTGHNPLPGKAGQPDMRHAGAAPAQFARFEIQFKPHRPGKRGIVKILAGPPVKPAHLFRQWQV